MKMEMLYQSFSIMFYSGRTKIDVSVKIEKPSFFATYPVQFNLCFVSVDHEPTIYNLRCSGLIVHFMILKNIPHTVGHHLARDQALTETAT